MSKRWPGKFVIGLTGNIATGKSVVRKMLEHLGAFGLDADALSHQAIAKNGPAYTAVVKMFGEWLLTADGEIDRAKLAKIVFADADMLARLEAVIHPIVSKGIDFLVTRAKAPVVAIEAIKLVESGLAADCDALWVVNASEQTQLARLMEKRKMGAAEARQRLAAQPPQADKIKLTAQIIDNSGAFEDTWTQVQAIFNQTIQPKVMAEAPTIPVVRPSTGVLAAKVRRGKPNDAGAIAAFIQQATDGRRQLTRADIMAAFGEKAYLLADYGGQLAAIAGWQIENLVTRVDEFYLAPGAPMEKLLPPLLEMVENTSKELQSEAALFFIPLPQAPAAAQVLGTLGYTPQMPEKLGVPAWKEAAKESMPPGTALLFKKLREDRVLRPV